MLEKPGAPKVSIKEDEGSNYISGSFGPSGKSRKDLFTPIAALLFQPISPSLQQTAIRELLQHNSGKLAIADLVNDKIEAKTELDTCAEIAEKVIEMQPDFSSPYWWKALVLLEKKEYEAAYVNLSQVITLSPTFANAYWYRGKLNEAFNNQEAAEMDLENFNKLNV
jgi:tetratricopeptide (TPR) repeat protein